MASVFAHSARLACAALTLSACADVNLDNVDHGGSTVPVPDMDGPVAFAENALTGAVLVSGTSGAVTPLAEVSVENQTTSTVDRTTATDLGAFSVLLTDAEVGDTVTITVEVDGETSDPVDLPLVYDGEPPAAPIEVTAYSRGELPGAEVAGAFVGAEPPLVVRVVNNTNGVVVEVNTVQELEHRGFEVVIDAEQGDEILINGTDPTHVGAPGRLARTEVVPP